MDIYVSNLPYGTASAEVIALFSLGAGGVQFRAQIREVRSMPDRVIKTFAYVQTADAEAGMVAMLRCDGLQLGGNVIRCSVAN